MSNDIARSITKTTPGADFAAGGADESGGAGAAPTTKIQEYGERVAKYVPAEVLAAYTTAVLFVSTDSDATFRRVAWIVVFVVFWILTPIWLGRFPGDRKTKRLNQGMGFLAFAVWAYAYPSGMFTDLQWQHTSLAGLFLLLFSFTSAFVYPKE